MTLEELLMNLKDLEEQIEEFTDREDSDLCTCDVEVMIATQPTWPLAFFAQGLRFDMDKDGELVLWISTGGQPSSKPYAPRNAWEENIGDLEVEDILEKKINDLEDQENEEG